MPKIFLIALLFFLPALKGFSQQSFEISTDVNRIVILGNSITYDGKYFSYVEALYRLNHPESKLEWINVGLPSETVSGLSEENHADGAFPRPDLHERLDRVFEQLQPDLVFVNYGMNDGIYLPLDEERFQKYKDGINWLSDKIEAIDASAIYLTPPVYDPAKGEAYANVLDNYSEWLLSKRYTDQWDVVDIHWPMRKFLEDQRKLEAGYFLAKDGIHPNATGHWLMAREILSFLGEPTADNFGEFEDAVAKFPNGKEVAELIFERQAMLRDAWLTSTRHLRPGLNIGIPLAEAEIRAEEIEQQIQLLLKTKH